MNGLIAGAVAATAVLNLVASTWRTGPSCPRLTVAASGRGSDVALIP